MSKDLWNKETTGKKPDWLTDDQKARCYCDDRGWVLVNLDGTEEVLVASNTLNDPDDRKHGFNPVAPGESLDPDRADAVAQKDLQLSDQDGDGIPSYRDADDNDPNVP